MNTALIDRIISTETDDEYFYAAFEGDMFYYGGCYTDGQLFQMLLALYESEPTSHPDLIEFANEILKSTGS